MATLLTPYADLLGLKVRVYRNLHNGLFSVQHRGRVIAHLPALTLRTASFAVQPAGRAKVLVTKRKNVHAFVTGTVVLPLTNPAWAAERVSYNPYEAAHFTFADGTAAHRALAVHIASTGIWAY